MSASSRALCICYTAIAVVALYGTWSQNLYYFSDLSLTTTIAAFGNFVVDIKANPATRSIGIDILLFAFAAIIWMVHEARKLGVRLVWVYVVLAFMIAISVTFPLFLIAREMKLAEGRDLDARHRPAMGDYVGLVMMGCVTLWLCWFLSSG